MKRFTFLTLLLTATLGALAGCSWSGDKGSGPKIWKADNPIYRLKNFPFVPSNRVDQCPTACDSTLYYEPPFFGYHDTCWQRWPEGWQPCPVEEGTAEAVPTPVDPMPVAPSPSDLPPAPVDVAPPRTNETTPPVDLAPPAEAQPLDPPPTTQPPTITPPATTPRSVTPPAIDPPPTATPNSVPPSSITPPPSSPPPSSSPPSTDPGSARLPQDGMLEVRRPAAAALPIAKAEAASGKRVTSRLVRRSPSSAKKPTPVINTAVQAAPLEVLPVTNSTSKPIERGTGEPRMLQAIAPQPGTTEPKPLIALPTSKKNNDNDVENQHEITELQSQRLSKSVLDRIRYQPAYQPLKPQTAGDRPNSTSVAARPVTEQSSTTPKVVENQFAAPLPIVESTPLTRRLDKRTSTQSPTSPQMPAPAASQPSQRQAAPQPQWIENPTFAGGTTMPSRGSVTNVPQQQSLPMAQRPAALQQLPSTSHRAAERVVTGPARSSTRRLTTEPLQPLVPIAPPSTVSAPSSESKAHEPAPIRPLELAELPTADAKPISATANRAQPPSGNQGSMERAQEPAPIVTFTPAPVTRNSPRRSTQSSSTAPPPSRSTTAGEQPPAMIIDARRLGQGKSSRRRAQRAEQEPAPVVRASQRRRSQ